MLESISARWPDVERMSDQPNDTSKVPVTSSCVPQTDKLTYLAVFFLPKYSLLLNFNVTYADFMFLYIPLYCQEQDLLSKLSHRQMLRIMI